MLGLLLAPGLMVALASLFVSPVRRVAVAASGVALLAAALSFIVAVNMGWVSP